MLAADSGPSGLAMTSDPRQDWRTTANAQWARVAEAERAFMEAAERACEADEIAQHLAIAILDWQATEEAFRLARLAASQRRFEQGQAWRKLKTARDEAAEAPHAE